MGEPEWTPLTSVVCVLRDVAPRVGALLHVARLLDGLLDQTATLTLKAAVAMGSVRLVNRVLMRIGPALVSPPPRCVEAQIALGLAIQVAVEKGRLDLVKCIHRLHPEPLSTRLMRSAARRGDLAMLRWLISHRSDGLCIPAPVQDDALSHGQLHCCFLEVYREALNHAQHEVIRWLFERGFVTSIEGAGDVAASSGDLEMVQWIHEQNQPYTFSDTSLDNAASAGHLAVVRFLVENRSEQCTIVGVNSALNAGHNEIVALLREMSKVKAGKDDAAATIVHAAATGHLDVLHARPHHENDRWHYEVAMYAAAEHGHVHVIDWISTELQVRFPPMARARAASYGQLPILQWAHALDRDQWSVDVMNSAAIDNHLGVVKWLHENRNEGCSTAAMNGAATNGHLEMVKWLHANRSEGCTTEAMNGAAYGGHLGVVQWLHVNRSEGCSEEAMDEAARNGHLEVVKWLHCHRMEGCTARAMDGAARGGHLAVLAFLHEYRSEGCSWEAAVAAAISGHVHVINWLREKYPLVHDAERVEDTRFWVGQRTHSRISHQLT